MPETEPAGQTVFTGVALADKDTGPNSQVVFAFNVMTFWIEGNYERAKSQLLAWGPPRAVGTHPGCLSGSLSAWSLTSGQCISP